MNSWTADGWLIGVAHCPSPNRGLRPVGAQVTLVVIHNISLPPGEFGGEWIRDLFMNRLDRTAHPYFAEIADLRVSAHFLVDRGGTINQFVSTDERAWHAGSSCWQGRENCNDFSVGIELEGADDQSFGVAQYEALWRLMAALGERFPISAIAGHSHVAPGRKTDPGPCFDWEAVRERFPDLQLPAEVAT